MTSLRAQLDAVLKQKSISLRVVAELIGKFNALTPGKRYGTVFSKRLEIQKTASLKQVSGDYDSLIFITAEMREDISWRRNNANEYPVLLSPHLLAITITTDTSNTGWGGSSDGVVTGGLWSKDEQSLHINCLELKAALLSIKAFISNKRNCFVHCRVEARYGPFDIDLFASRINLKVQCYVSRYKDSEAWRTDAFSFSWSHFFAYIFPPFSIILRVLNKIEMDEADCVVIVPCWKTQVWFPKLVALMIDVPILLIGSKQVLQHPHHSHPHPILNKSRMIACRLLLAVIM